VKREVQMLVCANFNAPSGRVEFSFDEDSRIVDIASNPEYVSRVSLSAWQDAVKTGTFGEKTACQVQSRYIRIRKVITKRADAGHLVPLRVCPACEFSFDEDSRIVDIASNPEYVSRVPLSAWQDAVKTGNIGEKTACQVQSRYGLLRTATKKRADAGSPALLRVGPPRRRRVEYSVGEDSRILDIANNPAHASCVPLSAWQDAVNTGDFGNRTV
jgi:ribosomal protein S19E (S16A)